MLDIGTANGDFPRMLKEKGWIVEGLEVSPNTSPYNEFPIYNCELPDIPAENSRYDLITAWAVFEHLHDPAAYFKKVGELLKPGAFFVFLVTNWKSAATRYLMLEDVPRHLYFYHEEIVVRYLEKNNMRLISHETNDKIFGGSPDNYIPWRIRKLLGKKFEWRDMPENRQRFLKRENLPRGTRSNISYAFRHPLVVLDRLLSPLIIKIQTKYKTYPHSLYIAQKQ